MKTVILIILISYVLNLIFDIVNYFVKRSTNKIIDDAVKKMYDRERKTNG